MELRIPKLRMQIPTHAGHRFRGDAGHPVADFGTAVSRGSAPKGIPILDRPLEGDWLYLWIDATYVKVSQAGRIVSVAVGANSDGRREVLGLDIGRSEAETFWTTLPNASSPAAACVA